MYTCLEYLMAIGRVVVYSARADHVFRAGIKCWHCKTRVVGEYHAVLYCISLALSLWIRKYKTRAKHRNIERFTLTKYRHSRVTK